MIVRFRVLDDCVRVDVDDDGLARILAGLVADLAPIAPSAAATLTLRIEAAPTGSHHRLLDASSRELASGRSGPVLGALLSHVTGVAVDRFGGLAVHAGAVAIDGHAIVLAAPSGTGKSTLTAACLLTGFQYVSDEAVCVRHRSQFVLPYPKPLAIAGASGLLLGLPRRRWDTKDLVTARMLGAAVPSSEVRVAHVVAVRRTGTGRSRLQEQTSDVGVRALLEMSFNAYRAPQEAIATANGVAAGARCWSMDVGDPFEAARAMAEVVTAAPAPC